VLRNQLLFRAWILSGKDLLEELSREQVNKTFEEYTSQITSKDVHESNYIKHTLKVGSTLTKTQMESMVKILYKNKNEISPVTGRLAAASI